MDVTNVIGDYGKFQRNVYLFTLLREAPSAIHLVIYSFFFPTVEYWCAMPETLVGNITSVQWELLALPNSSSYPRHQCEFLEFDVTVERVVVLGNTSMPCETWEYGRSYYKGSMVQEWDLVCDRAWMRSLAQTATMVGMLVGTLMSSLGDKIGRRPIIIAGYVICLFGSVCVAVSPSFSILVASRALLGSGLGMGQSSSFCLLMEVIGLKERTAAALALGVGFSLGIIMLPGLAWFIQDWRMLQWAITTPFLAFIIWSWFLPESPRWLVAKGKMSAARKVILKACTDNRLHVDDIDIVLAQLRKKILQGNRWDHILRTSALGHEPGRRSVPDVCSGCPRGDTSGARLLHSRALVSEASDNVSRVRRHRTVHFCSVLAFPRLGCTTPDMRNRGQDAGVRVSCAALDFRCRNIPDSVPDIRCERLLGRHTHWVLDRTIASRTANVRQLLSANGYPRWLRDTCFNADAAATRDVQGGTSRHDT
ncbi:organic cation transporter protein isoform X4 [Rhipicephalus microplus]|uniref:organic cation transporter protein isoform X4 n=1 Tax=Rhipicephalus microplus TaxID=6941 RepID=UPI003F6B3AEC